MHDSSDAIAPQRMAAVVLAGGRATRMGGQDKGLLPLAGRPLAAHVVERLRPQVDQVLINANRNADRYAELGCRVLADTLAGFQGPLAGMLAALTAMEADWLLTAPCDSPLLPDDYARCMAVAAARAGAELAVARDQQRLQPVFALLGRDLAGSLQTALAAGERKIDRWFARHRMVAVDFSHRPVMFLNANTPGELAELEKALRAERP